MRGSQLLSRQEEEDHFMFKIVVGRQEEVGSRGGDEQYLCLRGRSKR